MQFFGMAFLGVEGDVWIVGKVATMRANAGHERVQEAVHGDAQPRAFHLGTQLYQLMP